MALDPDILRDHPEWYCLHKGSLSPEETELVQELLAQRWLEQHPDENESAAVQSWHRLNRWRIHSLPAALRPAYAPYHIRQSTPEWRAKRGFVLEGDEKVEAV